MAAANAFAVSKGLPQDKIWRSWEHGPSKLFLNDLERSFNEEMVGHLRAQGVRVPVATTSSWGSNPLSSLPALTSGSIIDAHAYGGTSELEMNPAYSPNIVNWLAAAQVSGRPFSVSEWNVEQFPVPDRNAIPIYIASSASFQGWDALMQYAYAQDPLNNAGVASNWHAFNDPALMATLPAGALLYRRGDVREARTVFAFVPSADQLFNQEISPQTSVALRTASERGRLVIVMPMTEHLPWLEKSELPLGATKIVDPNQSLIGEGASAVISDTGELRRNWADGTYIVDTPRTQAAMGRIGGQKLGLTDVHIETMTRNATIAVQSLDENPIAMSRAIMISIAAKSVPNANNDLPFRSESVEGQVSIRAPRRLNLYAQELIHTPVSSHKSVGSRSGRLSKRLQATYKDGRYFINLMQASGRHFMVLK
jgi:hypothetical protein